MIYRFSFGNSLSLFTILFVLLTLGFDGYGQCGVFMKRSYTNLFPYRAYIREAEDMTGDGIPDLLATSIDNNNNRPLQIFVLPNNGNGTFGSPLIVSAPSTQAPFYINYLTGKFNGDSRKDIVTYMETAPASVLVYINNGGSFAPQTLVNASQMGTPLYLVDINNDGVGDYVGMYDYREIRYSLGNADGTFAAPVTLTTIPGSNTGVFSGDFNNDGKVDLIIGATVYLNQGGGIFSPSPLISLGAREYISAIKDFNGDGKSDILTQTTGSNLKISILFSSGSGFTRTDYDVSNQSTWDGNAYVGNFSGNSAPDVVYGSTLVNKTVVFTNDGAGNLTRQDFDYRFGNSNYFYPTITGDFDNDGKTDVIQASTGNYFDFTGTHKIFPEASYSLLKNVCNRPGQTRIVDFDRSNSTDYNVWNPSTGIWTYRTNSDSVAKTGSVNWGSGSLGDIPVAGDFDGDGITDYAVYRNSTGVWYILRSSNQSWMTLQFGLSGDKPVAADYDGDTITDIAVWRPSDGNWYIWFAGSQQFYAAHFGSNGDKPVPADFDGDLKTDLAVYRPSTGAWYYLKSSDGAFAAVQWGISSDKPVPADYDGDGKADLTVYRESENNLYILRSYNNAFAVYQYGIFQDVPQPGDFDGDFVADFGIYRPFSKQWYSTNSREQTNFGGDNVIPVSSILKVE